MNPRQTGQTAIVPTDALNMLDDEWALRLVDSTMESRVNLTRPSDTDNELIKVAALYGPPGILAVMRARNDYSWFVALCFRAIECCLAKGPHVGRLPVLNYCNPVEFSTQMLEIEMIDDIFMLMKEYLHLREVIRNGLAIVEILVMDDLEWRDEVARKGGVALICDIAKQWRHSPNLLCQVMSCTSYLAAEDYIEVMFCQHEALEQISCILRAEQYTKNVELITRTCLALLNLTVCEPHVEELLEKNTITPILEIFDRHSADLHLAVILCGLVVNFSVKQEARDLLAEGGLFPRVAQAMRADLSNAVLQVACMKALVNYSMDPGHYELMDNEDIPSLVGQAMVEHTQDPGVQKYGNYFLGQHASCPIL